MPMRRTDPLSACATEVARLQLIFRGALRAVLASSLASVACGGSADAAGAAAAGGMTAAGSVASEAGSAGVAGAGAAGAGAAGVAGKAAAGGTGGAAGLPVGGKMAGAGAAAGGGAQPPTCDGTVWQPLADLKPKQPFDFAALRMLNAPGSAPVEQAHYGTACAGASSPMKCNADLEATSNDLTLTDICGQITCRKYLVTTHADEVKRYASRGELLDFLGPIDAPQDALLVLRWDDYNVTCANSAVSTTPEGYETSARRMVKSCPVQYEVDRVRVAADGSVTVLQQAPEPEENACIGRRPEGLCESRAPRTDALGDYFASIARLEAASVTAFEVLAEELRLHAAPPELIEAALEAARDEVRHAQLTASLARRFGAEPEAPRVTARPARDLLALAIDNATEGCVRETFGAAMGCYQTLAASDAQVAQVFSELSRDELRHAALAQALDAWLTPRLSASERATVERARQMAVAELARAIEREPAPNLRTVAGVPDAASSRELHASLTRELWDTAS